MLRNSLPRDEILPKTFTRQVLLDPNFDAAGALVAELEGAVVGFCLAVAPRVTQEPVPPDFERGYVTLLAVLPGHRRRGLGESLLTSAEQHLARSGCRSVLISPYAPGYFTPGVDVETGAEALCFLGHRGYREIARPLAMAADLREAVRPAWLNEREAEFPSEGIRIEEWRFELSLPLLDFLRREFPGDWVRLVREAMRAGVDDGASARILLALQGDEVLGFAHWRGDRFGPIGVATAHRRRGVGQALLYSALDAMRFAGWQTAWFMWTDDITAARFYAPAGFCETRRFSVLRKDLLVQQPTTDYSTIDRVS